MNNNINNIFEDTVKTIDSSLGYGINYDIVRKELLIGGKLPAVYYYINSFGNSDIISKICSYLIDDTSAGVKIKENKDEYIRSSIPYAEASFEKDINKVIYFIFSGTSALVIDGCDEIIIIDSRKYPSRGIDEPANDRVLRGSREGFVEALVPNTGLIRRRIRDENLRTEKVIVGSGTKTDIVLCYLENKVNKKLLNTVKNKISSIDADAVNMGLESITELIIGGRWYNPFPRVRYTERPDTASSMIMEGSIILLCDNYSSAVILPTTFFSFAQDTNDFYFNPPIGRYLKMVRLSVYGLSIILTPLWYLLISRSEMLPEFLKFLTVDEPTPVPIIVQLLAVEICIDGLKLASLNTPDAMSNSLGIIGGLLLGDFAVTVGWLCPEVIFYMSFVAIANFTQPNFEMGYAFKFMRILSLVLIFFFSYWGLIAGLLITLLLIATTPTINGAPKYLYPLIPFDGRALKRLLFRATLKDSKLQKKENVNK